MAQAIDGLTLDFRDHVGIKNSPLGLVEVRFDQWVIVMQRDGLKVEAGIMRKASGCPLLWRGGRSEALSEYGILLVEQVERMAAEQRDELLGQPSGAPTNGFE